MAWAMVDKKLKDGALAAEKIGGLAGFWARLCTRIARTFKLQR